MRASASALAVVALCAGDVAARQTVKAQVTPVEKVIELLHSLQDQTAAEGKKEAAAYDKYACFCKEQADEKLYMIEKSEKKIAKLDAKINQLETDISELNKAIGDLAAEIDELTHKIDEDQEQRNHQHSEYKIVDADTVAAIRGRIPRQPWTMVPRSTWYRCKRWPARFLLSLLTPSA